MAKKILTLTQDHLWLIANLNYEEIDDNHCGMDRTSLYGGTFVMEDVALCIGKLDQSLPNTENDYDGRKFPTELTNYMWELHLYVWENLEYIESLIHQFVISGGITPGKYSCIDYEKIWKKIE